jgi:type IV secretory pathway TraG/TraD family ATPase VirD4
LIGHSSIPATAYARFVIDTAAALGNRREQSFFKSAAQIHIAQAQLALAALDFEVTLENVYHLLTDVDEMKEVVTALETRRPELARHFQKFLAQPPEQLSGITGTVINYLHHFTKPEIVEVFCRDNTFSLKDMDRGKIICLALPQKFQTERRYVSTFLKLLFYSHALQRFDLPESERRKRNMLLFLADECQHFLSQSEDGLSDHNVVDVLREAGVAFIAATQSSTSLAPLLGAENSKVLTLNLRNRMVFAAADEEDARSSAEFLGKKFAYEYSETSGDGRHSRTRHRKEKYRIEPHKLRALRNHECVLVHAEKGFERCVLPPIEPDGSVCRWFRRRWRWLT